MFFCVSYRDFIPIVYAHNKTDLSACYEINSGKAFVV